jgi:tetrahydromethanopterin S-methyltransferase subunit H
MAIPDPVPLRAAAAANATAAAAVAADAAAIAANAAVAITILSSDWQWLHEWAIRQRNAAQIKFYTDPGSDILAVMLDVWKRVVGHIENPPSAWMVDLIPDGEMS